jgi:oligopeptide transport system substrate-binding protein
VEALVVADHSTALNLYESGRLDFTTDLSPVDLKRLEKNPALKVFPYLKTVYLGMVTDHPFLRDPRARQAIAMSLEKHSLTRMLQGGQTPATSFVPPRMDGHDPESGLRYDLKQAATLWNSIPEKERPKKLSLITQNWDKNIAVGQYLQEQLRKGLNLEIEILSLDHKAYQAVAAGGKHPLFLRSWSADYPDPENFLSVFLSDSGNNRARWKSFKFDQKVRAATENLQQKERLRLYREAQRILLQEEAVIVPLYYEPNVTLLRPGVEGLVLTPLNSLFLKGVRFPRPPSN